MEPETAGVLFSAKLSLRLENGSDMAVATERPSEDTSPCAGAPIIIVLGENPHLREDMTRQESKIVSSA